MMSEVPVTVLFLNFLWQYIYCCGVTLKNQFDLESIVFMEHDFSKSVQFGVIPKLYCSFALEDAPDCR